MNTRKSRLITLATIVLLIILAVPAAFAAAGGISLDTDANTQIGVDGVVLPTKINEYQVPTEIDGLPVVAVDTCDTNPSLSEGGVILYLANTKKGVPEPEQVSVPKSLPEGWSIGLVGNSLKDETPREIRDRIQKTQDEWIEFVEQLGYVPTSHGFNKLETTKSEKIRDGYDDYTRTYSW